MEEMIYISVLRWVREWQLRIPVPDDFACDKSCCGCG